MSNWRIYLDTDHNNQYNSGEPYDYTFVGVYGITAAPGTYDIREEIQSG